MFLFRFIVVIALVAALAGCKHHSAREQAKQLMNEANALLAQDSELTHRAYGEYKKAFSLDELAKFPANRESLTSAADKLMPMFGQSSELNRIAADKYYQAGKLLDGADEKRGVALFADSMQKNVETAQLMTSQLKLFGDQKIADPKTLKEKIEQSWGVIIEKQKESQRDITQGRRLLGI